MTIARDDATTRADAPAPQPDPPRASTRPELESFAQIGEVEFRRLLERLPAGAYTCDLAGLITYYNPCAAELWGRAPKLNDPSDRFCGSFKLFSGDGVPVRHDECWMALALSTEREYNGQEIIIERPDGQRLTALAHANPLRDDTGKLRGAVNVVIDISDRKRAEEALRHADRSKDEFLATLAHELRNPLAPLRNAVQVLRTQGTPTPDARAAMEVIERQMRQMTRLIDDLLDVSRITRNRLELRTERVDLANVLAAALETSRPLMDELGHRLTLSPPEQPIYLDADFTRLAQAVSNLLNNAAKFTERGGEISLVAERQGGDAVITIRDNGIGIPPDMVGRVFEMFTQVDRSIARAHGGLGIGLTLVRRLVELHGGTVRAHSDGPGRGSAFVIRLPALSQPAPHKTSDVAATDVDHRRSNGDGNSHNGGVRPLRVLVVDDSRDSANTLAMLLRITGNNVRTAYDGEEAVAAASEFLPDVMLLDIGMPRMSGYDAARAVRAQPWGKSPMLIALTGWGQDEDRERSRAAGFDHHIVKPVEPKSLLALLASVTPSQSTQR